MKYLIIISILVCGTSGSSYSQNSTDRQKAIELTGKGIRLFAMDSFEKAIPYFDRAIIADNSYEEARLRRGNALLALKKDIEALKDFKWLEIQHSTNAEVYDKIGDIIFARFDIDVTWPAKDARHYYSLAIWYDSTQGSYYAKRGLLVFDVYRQYDSAATDLQKAIDLAYTSAEIYSKLGFCYMSLNDNKKAVFYFSKAIAKDPSNMEDFANRGNALVAIHQLEGAVDDLTFYLKYDSADASVWYNLARAQYGLHKYDPSIRSMKRVLALDPKFGDSWFRLGLAYADKGAYQEAINAFTNAIAQAPREAYLYYNRAVARAKNDPQSDYCSDLKIAADMGYEDAINMVHKMCKK